MSSVVFLVGGSDLILGGFAFLEIKNGYLSAGAVAEEYKGLGIYPKLMKARISTIVETGGKVIRGRTQNPRVEYTIRKCLEEMGIAYLLIRELRGCAYGRALTYFHKSKNESINRVYRDSLDLERGDAFFLTFHLL